MCELTVKQSVGYIVKAFSMVDDLTLEQFIEAIYVTLDVVNSDKGKLNKTKVMILLVDVLRELDIDNELQTLIRSKLYYCVNNYSIIEAEESYNEYVTEDILNKFYE